MKIVVPSKNGELFLPYLLKSLEKTNPGFEICVVNRGYKDESFLDKLNVTKINPTWDHELNTWNEMEKLDDDIILLNDSMIIKSRKFFDDILYPDTDIRMWKTFNVMNDTDQATYEAMIDFLPIEYWKEDGCHGTIAKFSKKSLKLMKDDKLFGRYTTFDRTIHGFMFERLVASYIRYLGGTSSEVEKSTLYEHRYGITIISSDTAVKYFTSSLFGYLRNGATSNIPPGSNLSLLLKEMSIDYCNTI